MINAIGIHLKVKDFNKSFAFYSALGFKKVFEYGPTKDIIEDYNGAVFEHAGGKLEIADGHRAVNTEVFKEKLQNSKVSLMINVNNLEDIISRAMKAGIPIAVAPRHYYWGTLELVIKDPDGLVLVFISPYDTKIARKIKANETFSKKP